MSAENWGVGGAKVAFSDAAAESHITHKLHLHLSCI